jgi:crotonobetainyl-CoA:carnitine CoA-transferase CaiB-like acyl-CoA transferase
MTIFDRKNPPNALLNSYQTSDGRWFMLVAEGVRRWPALINAVGHPEWASDERFSERSGRAVHAGALTRLLEEAFAAHPFEYWAAALDKAWIPYSLIYTIEENALAPLADLPVREIVAASHILTDLTLASPTVVHDYLA